MINNLKKAYLNLDKKAMKILKKGWKFCTILCITSLIALIYYILLSANPLLYKIGISLFKLSITFAIEFLICAYAVDFIKKTSM